MNIVKEIEFPDVSFYQREIDFSKMGRTAILRAGQNVWVDTQFERNRSEAVRLGINWGLYWFYDDRVSPGAQADKLFTLFSSGQAQPNMEIWCDWESTYAGNYGSLANVVAFMQRVEKLMPWAKVGMYTGYYWWMEHTHPLLNLSHFLYLKNKPLWLAWYVADPAYVKIPRPWSELTLWQYGTPTRGAEFGVKTLEIDMNWFNGTIDQFEQRYGGVIITPPTEDMIMPWTGKTLDSIAVRTEKDGGTIAPYLPKGTNISGDAADGSWLHMTNPRVGWVNAGANKQFVDWKPVTVVPPVDPPPVIPPVEPDPTSDTAYVITITPQTGGVHNIKVDVDNVTKVDFTG